MEDKLKTILKNTCGLLNKHEVEYLIIGGTAVNFYGFNRPTMGHINNPNDYDLDFWYNPTLKNYTKIINALKELGWDSSRYENDVVNPKESFLRIQHNGFKTDFLPIIPGLEKFHKSYQTKKQTQINDVIIPFISLDDLIKNKQFSSRENDLNDINNLEKLHPRISKSSTLKSKKK